MRGAMVKSRTAARIAVAGLSLGVLALAGITLLSSTSTRRATENVRAFNRAADAWGQVFQQINVEDDATRIFVTSKTNLGRQPLETAVAGATPTLDWLVLHGSAVDAEQATQIRDAYAAYTATLTEMITAGKQGDTSVVRLLAGQAEALAAGVRLHVTANVDRTRLEVNAYLDDVDHHNGQVRVAAFGAFGVDIALLALCGAVLIGYQRRVERQAAHDALTDLPNRTLLNDRAAQAVRAADRERGRVGLLLIDLNGFKEINDTLGHHCGDLLLQQVARRLRQAVRTSDTVARLGGDEFAVLAPRLGSVAELERLADRVLAELSRPVEVDGRQLEISGSIGAAIHPANSRGVDQLLQHADIAMYAAKRGRVGFAMYHEKLNEHSAARLSILAELRRALASDEFVLYYQPLADARTRRTRGVEALARWQHPTRGLLGRASSCRWSRSTA